MACHQQGWPPKACKDIKDDRFNTTYVMNDANNYRIICWVDNDVVNMASNVHKGDEVVKSVRRKLRPTSTNRNHLNTVWGTESVKEIKTPKVIDNYNHWMNGVDKADQLTAYYCPNLQCRCVWMPIWFHCLDAIRVNSHIACSQLGWRPARQNTRSQHKECTMEFIKAIIAKAKTFEMRATRQQILGHVTNPSPPNKRSRTSTRNPSLPDHRLFGDPRDHIRADAPTQRQCRMCSYLCVKARNEGVTPLPKTRRPMRWCLACKDNLCNEHFDAYHRR